MVKISTSLVGVLLLATLSAASSINDAPLLQQSSANWTVLTDTPHITYYFAATRGAYNGFRTGFYNNASEALSQDCLGATTIATLNQFIQMITSMDIMQMIRAFGSFYQVGFQIQNSCKFNQIEFDVIGFCLNSTNNCTVDNLIANGESSFFQMTGVLNNVAATAVELYFGFNTININDLVTAASTFSSLGNGLGKVCRTVLGFTATMSSGARKPLTPTQ